MTTEANIERLLGTYEMLPSQHWERIRRRAEKAIRKLIHAEYQRRVRAEFPALCGTPFPNIGARRRAAERRTGVNREDVFGGVLDVIEAMTITNDSDVTRCLEAAQNATDEGVDPSILVQAQNVGIGEGAVVRCIREASDTVNESARLRQARDAYERAAAAVERDEQPGMEIDVRRIDSPMTRRRASWRTLKA